MDYLIVYNHQQSLYDVSQIHNTIIALPISDWWHYLPNVYIVRSEHIEQVLADGIIARNPGLLFLIIKVDLNHTNGLLNKSAWEWINNKARTLFKLKPAPTVQPRTLNEILGLPLVSQSRTNSWEGMAPPPFLSDFFKNN